MSKTASDRPTVDLVTEVLQDYADRGVFQRFGRRRIDAGRAEYRFLWHGPEPHRLRFEDESRELTFVDLLPGVPYRSPLDRELRRFLLSRQSDRLPEHRRFDPDRIEIRARNRSGAVSLVVRDRAGDLAWTTRKAVKLVNEIFLSCLAGPWEEYMVEHFGAVEE